MIPIPKKLIIVAPLLLGPWYVLEFVWLVEPIDGSGVRLKARVGGVRVDLAECPDHVHQFIRYFVVSCVTCKIECSTSYCLHTTFLE